MRFSAPALLLLAVVCAAPSISEAGKVPTYDTSAKKGKLLNFTMTSRTTLSYGYSKTKVNPDPQGAPDGYGYGMGALEQIAYDSKERILYGLSEQGYVTLTDYANPSSAKHLPYVIGRGQDTYTDVTVCPEKGLLFVTKLGSAKGEKGAVELYSTAKRSPVDTSAAKIGEGDVATFPVMLREIEVGYHPDMVSADPLCETVAVANEGEGYYTDEGGLVNPPGSVTLIRGASKDGAPEVVTVSLNGWTDEDLIGRDVHLPLSLNGMKYWNEHSAIADDLNFDGAIEEYESEDVLEPEGLAWSADGKTLFVNLQENAALVTVDAATGMAKDISGYGLKSWSETPIDLLEDDGCSQMNPVPGLYSTLAPDAIASVVVDGKTYILTANEGDDVEYGDYEEKTKSKDIFSGPELGLKGATAVQELFVPGSPGEGWSKHFNGECDEAVSGWCSTSVRMTVGSSMVDYSDPTAPVITKMVSMGGRGISIFEVPKDGGLELTWDSGSDLEVEGCKAYPWAHNGVQDEEFAPLYGELYNSTDDDLRETLMELNDPEEDGCEDSGDGTPGACPLGSTVDERSPKDGYAAESIVVGEACGNLYAVTVSEKNSVGYLYDISAIASPALVQVFHLSPASEKLSPGLAYEAGTLGEIDAEGTQFLSAEDSPTGRAAVLFPGAWSGTISYWEFRCEEEDAEPPADDGSPAPTANAALATGAALTAAAAFLM